MTQWIQKEQVGRKHLPDMWLLRAGHHEFIWVYSSWLRNWLFENFSWKIIGVRRRFCTQDIQIFAEQVRAYAGAIGTGVGEDTFRAFDKYKQYSSIIYIYIHVGYIHICSTYIDILLSIWIYNIRIYYIYTSKYIHTNKKSWPAGKSWKESLCSRFHVGIRWIYTSKEVQRVCKIV